MIVFLKGLKTTAHFLLTFIIICFKVTKVRLNNKNHLFVDFSRDISIFATQLSYELCGFFALKTRQKTRKGIS